MDTIADSLGAPRALPCLFELCRQHIDEIVRVTDAELRLGMQAAFSDLKLAVKPAGAAVAAALLGPLRELVRGRKVGTIICGSNIDGGTFTRLLNEDNTVPASG